jgi:hypothetical protein
MREPVNPSQRLSITLRYLAIGISYKDVKFSLWMCLLLGRQMVSEWILSGIVHRLSYIFEIE